MADKKPLSDNQIGDRLHAAREILGDEAGKTVRGNTALDAARKALSLLQVGLLYAAEKNSDVVETVIDQPARPSPSPDQQPRSQSEATPQRPGEPLPWEPFC